MSNEITKTKENKDTSKKENNCANVSLKTVAKSTNRKERDCKLHAKLSTKRKKNGAREVKSLIIK